MGLDHEAAAHEKNQFRSGSGTSSSACCPSQCPNLAAALGAIPLWVFQRHSNQQPVIRGGVFFCDVRTNSELHGYTPINLRATLREVLSDAAQMDEGRKRVIRNHGAAMITGSHREDARTICSALDREARAPTS